MSAAKAKIATEEKEKNKTTRHVKHHDNQHEQQQVAITHAKSERARMGGAWEYSLLVLLFVEIWGLRGSFLGCLYESEKT